MWPFLCIYAYKYSYIIIIAIIAGSKYEQYHLAGRAVIGRRQEEVQAILHLLRFLFAHYLRIQISYSSSSSSLSLGQSRPTAGKA